MKKTSIFLGALALFAISFTACKDNDPEVIIEDGFYVAGSATGADALNVDYRLAPGINEVEKDVAKQKRAGMYEKYVALEANKEFYLLLKEGAVETRYGATLTDKVLNGENEQPTLTLKKGSLVKGTTAPTMKVTKSGLYHIVLDLNLDKALDLTGGAQVIIAPVEWGVRGMNGDWGWKKMKSPVYNRTEMTWDTTIVATKDGKYKFAYGGGWKIQLDDAGKVKANTNLGEGNVQGGSDISIDKGDNVKITLKWNLKSGEISKSYTTTTTAGKWYYDEVAKAKFSLIGSAFNNAAGTAPAAWDYDLDLPYVASKSTITDATKFYGTYVFEKTGVVLLANGEFKVRRDLSWDINFGYNAANIKGSTANFADKDGNIKVVTAGTYDVQFKYTTPAKTWELTLTKK